MAALTLFASVALWSRHDAGNRRESADEVASKAETGGENIPVTSLSGGGVSVPMDSIAESARMENIPPTTLASAKSEIGGVMSEKTKADFAFLLGTNPPPGTDVQAWRAEKNAIMDAWGSQKETSGDLAGVLVAISTDANQDVVVRDYALQHMVSIYSSAVSDRVRMQDALYQALD